MMHKSRFGAARTLGLIAGLSLGMSIPFALAADAVTVSDAYARAVPPGQPNSAVFMVLRNAGAEDRAVVSAASPVSDVVELHTHRMEDGMMKMRQVEQITLPAGDSVTLKPGGLHVMLIGLQQQLQPGDEVAVTLTLDDGTELPLAAPVRKVEPMSQMHDMPGMHHGGAD
jgi:copper(I)-binding protein